MRLTLGFQQAKSFKPSWLDGVLLFLALLLSLPAFAQTQYTTTHWSAREGAPADVRTLAQTPDGFLWLGTSTGLYRFDGLQFTRIEPPLFPKLPNSIRALVVDAKGGLWIGAGHSVALFKDGRIGKTVNLPEGTGDVLSLSIGHDGRVRILTSSSLLAIQPDGPKVELRNQGVFNGALFFDALFTRDGSVWLATNEGVFRQQAPRLLFEVVAKGAGYGKLAEDASGAIWFHDVYFGLRQFQPGQEALHWDTYKGGTILATPDGRVFFNSARGVFSAQVPHPTSSEGRPLLGETAVKDTESFASLCMLIDSEGNIWAGSYGGIARFRPNRVSASAYPGNTGGIAARTGGGIYMIGYGRGLFSVGPKNQHLEQAGSRLTYIYRDRSGITWIGGWDREELLRVENDVVTKLPLPPMRSGTFIEAIGVDGGGAPWFASQHVGVFKWDGRQWIDRGGFNQLPNMVTAFATDERGDLWLGSPDDQLFRIHGSHLEKFTSHDGLSIGTIKNIAVGQGKVVLAGGDGIAIRTPGGFRSLLPREGQFVGVSGLVMTTGGELWVSQIDGLVRVSADELEHAVIDPDYRVRSESFDYRDGLDGGASQTPPLPSVAQADDGRIWVATNSLASIDPAAISRNKRAPQVQIQTLKAGGEVRSARPRITLPTGEREVVFSFTAPVLTDAVKARFRYRLVGFQDAWRETGLNREASYTNLSPGQYDFEVMAANNDGVWSTSVDRVHLVVPAYFYETLWFRLVVALSLVLVIYYLLRLHTARTSQRVRDRLQAQALEREKIARDLHDTLLQGVQGLILQLQVIMDNLPDSTRGQSSISAALYQAEELMKEGRARVGELRPGQDDTDLAGYLNSVAEAFRDGTGPVLEILQGDETLQLTPMVNAEVRRIISEALINALRHANATRIELRFRRTGKDFCVEVRDDGHGIEPEILQAGGRPGHWGFAGMRERAERLGGTLHIASRLELGTRIELHIPAGVAFGKRRKAPGRWRSALARRFGAKRG